MDVWVVSSIGWLQIMWLSTFAYDSLNECVLAFLLDNWLGIERLYHMADVDLAFEETDKLHIACTVLHFHKQCISVSAAPHPCQHMLWLVH